MRITFIVFMLIHGLIHIMGFFKAYGWGNLERMTLSVSKQAGVFWLSAALMLFVATVLFILRKQWWIWTMIPALILSQVLIIGAWQDARFGTILNVVIAVVAILSWGSYRFENQFREDLRKHQLESQNEPEEILTESDLANLPESVKRYLRYAGVVNKPKVRNFKVVFEGEMREKGKDYFPFRSEQFNFMNNPTRLFFMKAQMFGLTVPGYHKYTHGLASMDVRLFGLVPVAVHKGEIMNQTETVTFFNDMCLLAPATLIDKRINWEAMNDTMAKATFTNGSISVSAVLTINERGQLTNFVSEDRSAVAEMKKYPFSTPVSSYQDFNGHQLMSYGEAVWHYPDGPFTYGKFNLKEIEYNVK